jgi:hypothetical protein
MIRCSLVMALVIACAALGAHAQLYKWIDKDGKVQYSDTPPPPEARSGAPLRVQSGAGTPAPASASLAEQEKALAKRREDASKAESKAAEDAKLAEKHRERCDQARSYLATLNDGGRLVRTNANGEREFLDDAAIEAERKRAQVAISESCKP